MRFWSTLAAAVAITVLSTPAHASLVGDQISVRIAVPNISSFEQTQLTTVAADASDALVFDVGLGIQITVDPGPDSFAITGTGSSGGNMGNGSVFEFTDLDFTPTAAVTGASYTHNWNFVNANTSFTPNSASVNFTGNSSFSVGRLMTVNLETAPVSTVPTVSVWSLIALTLLTLAGGALVLRRSIAARA